MLSFVRTIAVGDGEGDGEVELEVEATTLFGWISLFASDRCRLPVAQTNCQLLLPRIRKLDIELTTGSLVDAILSSAAFCRVGEARPIVDLVIVDHTGFRYLWRNRHGRCQR